MRTTHVAFLGAPALDYREVNPPAALAPWVAVAWHMRAREPFDLRILPDGCMDLIGDDVIGSLSSPIVVHFEAGDTASGLRFHPGGLPALLGVPGAELVDLDVPLRELVRAGAARRRSSPPILQQLADDADRPDPLARAAFASTDLRHLARESGYSERQVRRRVLAATGHSPKRLMRIGRMQRLLLGGRQQTWARTAAEHGFFDEAHMVNDIRDLAGCTPQALSSLMADPSKPSTPGRGPLDA